MWPNQLSKVLIFAMLWTVQVESSREANDKALKELSEKLEKEYEEKLLEEQRRHREEIENLQVCILWSLFIHTSHFVFVFILTAETKPIDVDYLRK